MKTLNLKSLKKFKGTFIAGMRSVEMSANISKKSILLTNLKEVHIMNTLNLNRLNSHFSGVTCHTEYITDYLKFSLRLLLMLLLSMALMGVALAAKDDDNGVCNGSLESPDAAFEQINLDGLVPHLEAMELHFLLGRIFSGNTEIGRKSGMLGYNLSVIDVFLKLKAAGYDPEIQEVLLDYWGEIKEPTVSATTASSTINYINFGSPLLDFSNSEISGVGDDTIDGDFFGGDFRTQTNSPSRSIPPTDVVEVTLVPDTRMNAPFPCKVGSPKTSKLKGKVALVPQIGNLRQCGRAFNVRWFNANSVLASHKAVAMVLGRDVVRLDTSSISVGVDPMPIPGINLRLDKFEELLDLVNPKIAIDIAVKDDDRTTFNVIADSKCAETDDVIAIGGHLDSLPWIVGATDNGSGVAAVLEAAKLLANVPTKHVIRYVFFAQGEGSRFGQRFYVDSLTESERDKIKIYLGSESISADNGGAMVGRSDDSDIAIEAMRFFQADFTKEFRTKEFPITFDDDTNFIRSGSLRFDLCVGFENATPTSIPCTVIATGFSRLRSTPGFDFNEDFQVDLLGTPNATIPEYDLFNDATHRCRHQQCDDLARVNLPLFEVMSQIYADVLIKLAEPAFEDDNGDKRRR